MTMHSVMRSMTYGCGFTLTPKSTLRIIDAGAAGSDFGLVVTADTFSVSPSPYFVGAAA